MRKGLPGWYLKGRIKSFGHRPRTYVQAFSQLTFPKPKYSNALDSQAPTICAVPPLVVGQLLDPISSVRLRYVATIRTPVPETSVDEDCEPAPWEIKVGNACERLNIHTPPTHSFRYKRCA